MNVALGMVLLLLFVGSFGYAGSVFARSGATSSSAAPRFLVALSAALCSATLVIYTVGAVGLLSRGVLVAAALLVALGTALATRRGQRLALSGQFGLPQFTRSSESLAFLTLAAVLSLWMIGVFDSFAEGLGDTDPMWYQMPAAARFFQSGSLFGINYSEPLMQVYFMPATGAFPHALGMIFFAGQDWLSPLVNLGWLALALAAGASIGLRHRAGIEALIATAIVVATSSMVMGESGSAKTDLAALAAFLAAIALLSGARSPRDYLLVGAMAGLAISIKLTVALPLLGAAAVIAVRRTEVPRRSAFAAFAAGGLALGSFWFVRNLIATGSPAPWAHIPLLPWAGPAALSGQMLSIAGFYSKYPDELTGNLHLIVDSLGDAAIPMLLLGGLGILACLSGRLRFGGRMLGALGLFSLVGFIFTPNTAAGIPGHVLGLTHTRYGAPTLALGLICAGIALRSLLPDRFRVVGPVLLLVILILTIASNRFLLSGYQADAFEAAFLITGLLVGAAALARSGIGGKGAAVALLAAVCVVVPLGRQLANSYRSVRNVAYSKHLILPGAQRIGLLGDRASFDQYRLFGDGLTNTVQFIGIRGPHGAFRAVRNCQEMKAAINAGHYSAIYVGGRRDLWRLTVKASPEESWLDRDRSAVRLTSQAAQRVSKDHGMSIFRVSGPLSAATC